MNIALLIGFTLYKHAKSNYPRPVIGFVGFSYPGADSARREPARSG